MVYTQLAKHNPLLRALPGRPQCYGELVAAGVDMTVPFHPDEPITTVANLLLHSSMDPDSFQIFFDRVAPQQRAPEVPGPPMLRAALPFPPAFHRLRGSPTYAFFAHNTTIPAALNILKQGKIRLSIFEINDPQWIPSAAFYSHGSVHNLRQACRYGRWNSARPQ